MIHTIAYPIPEQIIEYNIIALSLLKMKKADQPKVLSYQKIVDAIEDCKKEEGDTHSKAAVLLMGLVRKHPFASGNRRTAFIVTKDFLLRNNAICRIKDDPSYIKVMLGIRENYYGKDEVMEWIKHGKIREFKR